MDKLQAKQQPFLLSNVPFWHKNNPDATLPAYKVDYKAFSASKTDPVSKPTPALIEPRDLTHIREVDTETRVSYKAHSVQPCSHISRWEKLSTNFKMPTSSRQDVFVTSNRAFQGLLSEHQRIRSTAKTSSGVSCLHKLGHIEKLPPSTHQDSYTAPDSSCVDRQAALGPDPSIPTLKGDGHLTTYETHYNSTFDTKPLSQGPTAVKSKQMSAVSLGDKERICERQSNHTVSFTRPTVYSLPVQKELPQFHLGHTATQSWSCTSREAYCRHVIDPVVLVTRNENLSSVPKGDMDPLRDQERMSHTTSSTSYTKLKPTKRPETDAGLMTRSNVPFSTAGLQSSDYSTTSTEHYGVNTGVERQTPASYAPSNILSEPDQGPNLSVTHTDYPPMSASKTVPSASQQMTNIKFPVAARLYTTTHNEAYTSKTTTAPKPVPNQLRCHIVMQ